MSIPVKFGGFICFWKVLDFRTCAEPSLLRLILMGINCDLTSVCGSPYFCLISLPLEHCEWIVEDSKQYNYLRVELACVVTVSTYSKQHSCISSQTGVQSKSISQNGILGNKSTLMVEGFRRGEPHKTAEQCLPTAWETEESNVMVTITCVLWSINSVLC
jgi:hypothetical protein